MYYKRSKSTSQKVKVTMWHNVLAVTRRSATAKSTARPSLCQERIGWPTSYLVKIIPELNAYVTMFRVIISNIEIAITLPGIDRFCSTFVHGCVMGLQRSRSDWRPHIMQSKVGAGPQNFHILAAFYFISLKFGVELDHVTVIHTHVPKNVIDRRHSLQTRYTSSCVFTGASSARLHHIWSHCRRP